MRRKVLSYPLTHTQKPTFKLLFGISKGFSDIVVARGIFSLALGADAKAEAEAEKKGAM